MKKPKTFKSYKEFDDYYFPKKEVVEDLEDPETLKRIAQECAIKAVKPLADALNKKRVK